MSNTIKLIIIGILILAIPVSIKLVQQQQILKSRASDSSLCANNDGTPPYPFVKGTPCGDGKVCDGQGVCIDKSSSDPCRTEYGDNLDAGTLCGSGKVCDGKGNCIAKTSYNNPCQTEFGDNLDAGTSCGSGKVCDGKGNCIEKLSYNNPCRTEYGDNIDAGISCGSGKVCNGRGFCIDEANYNNPCRTDFGDNIDAGTACGSGKICDGGGNCITSGGSVPPPPPPPQGGSNYCANAGFFPCTVGVPNGSCSGGTNWTRYQCNFNGQDYCDNNCVASGTTPPPPGSAPPPTGTQPSTCKIPMASFPKSSVCNPIPAGCTTNQYYWVIVQPGTGGAPAIDATKYGANNACSVHSDCPKNTSDSANVNAATSNWCYEFTEGNRCIQLRHVDDSPSCGGTTGGGTCSSIVTSKTQLSTDCARCIDSNDTRLKDAIRGLNTGLFAGCSTGQLISYWCDGGISAQATADCSARKTGILCATSCGSGTPGVSPSPGQQQSPSPSGSSAAPLSCNVSGSSSITRGSSATFTATTTDSRVKRINFFYSLGTANDVNIGTQWNVLANSRSSACRATAGGCSAEIPADSIPAGTDKIFLTCNAFTADVDDPFAVEATNPAARCTGNPLAMGKTPANPYISPNGQYYADCGSGSRKEVAIVTAPTPTPSTFTTQFRIAENPTDLAAAEWKEYTAEGMTVDYDFKTPGQKFIFVQFKDSTGKITTTTDCPKCQAQIKILGPNPAITSCSLGFEGNNTVLNLVGTNFGSTQGTIKSGETNLQVKQWKDGGIQIVWPNASEGKVLPVSLTNLDGQIGEGTCGAIAQLALGAKVFCRAPSSFDTDNVDLTLADTIKVLVKQKVKIDKDGIVLGLTQKLEEGKNYTLSMKAPKGIRQTVSFTAGGGITNIPGLIPGFILPIGDIFPIDGGDGVINTLDKSELNRQWVIDKVTTGRSGDFNQDTRVNSIDWACMRYDFGKKDNSEAAPGVQPSPFPSPSPSVSPSPSPSPAP